MSDVEEAGTRLSGDAIFWRIGMLRRTASPDGDCIKQDCLLGRVLFVSWREPPPACSMMELESRRFGFDC